MVAPRMDLSATILDAAQPVIREPHGAVITPDGKTVFVINHLVGIW